MCLSYENSHLNHFSTQDPGGIMPVGHEQVVPGLTEQTSVQLLSQQGFSRGHDACGLYLSCA